MLGSICIRKDVEGDFMSNIFGERYTDGYHFGELVGYYSTGTSTKKLYDYYTAETIPDCRNAPTANTVDLRDEKRENVSSPFIQSPV